MKLGKIYLVAALYTVAMVISVKCIVFLLGV